MKVVTPTYLYMVQNSNGQTVRMQERGKKAHLMWASDDEVENVATQPGVIALTDSQDGWRVLLAAPQIRVQQHPRTISSLRAAPLHPPIR